MIDLGSRAPANSPESEPEPERRRGVFKRLRESLSKSRAALTEEISASLFDRIDDETWERLEEALILADAGAPTTATVVERLEHEVDSGAVPADGIAVRDRLIEILAEVAATGRKPIDLSAEPAVLMMVGVNGTGKTTSIGKLATLLKAQGQKPLVCAADTFRAAAVEQLEIWTRRAEVGFIRAQPNADPAAVVFDAIQAARARGLDPVLVDTAGRLHTRVNLMNELEKIKRIAAREVEGAPHEVLLVLDATVGQNGVAQAREFMRVSGVNGIILTKLDGTAKGGVAVAIAQDLELPIRFVGTGEQIDDLVPFSPREYVDALFEEAW